MRNLNTVEMNTVAGGAEITAKIIDTCNPFMDVTFKDASDATTGVLQINLHTDTTNTANGMNIADAALQAKAMDVIYGALINAEFLVGNYTSCPQ